MKSAAVFVVLCGILALFFELFQSGASREMQQTKAHVVAVNFALFRNAAQQYVHDTTVETVATSEISRTTFEKWLPNGWQPVRDWKVRVETSGTQWVCYVFGPVESDEVDAIRRLFRGSFAVGRAEGGQLVPNHNKNMRVPDWIPNGNVVSMTVVQARGVTP